MAKNIYEALFIIPFDMVSSRVYLLYWGINKKVLGLFFGFCDLRHYIM